MASLSGRQFEPRLFAAFERLIRGLQNEWGEELERFSSSSESPSNYQRAFRVIDALFDSPRPAQRRSNVPETSNSARPELTIVAENR
jgi:hypothetical protein